MVLHVMGPEGSEPSDVDFRSEMAIVVNDIVKQQSRDDSNNHQSQLNGADDEVEGAEHNSQVRVHISNRESTRMVGEHVMHVTSFDLVGL